MVKEPNFIKMGANMKANGKRIKSMDKELKTIPQETDMKGNMPTAYEMDKGLIILLMEKNM